MVNWLTEQEFNKKWEENHKPKKEFMTPAIAIKLNLQDIEKLADTDVFIDEIEGIGTGHYWTGEIDGALFSIEVVELIPNIATIYLPKSENIFRNWEFIKICNKLFDNCTSKIIWILSKEDGDYSLFYKKSEVTYCIYTSTTEKSAEKLMNYLQENGCTLFMSVALTDHHFNNWSAYCKGETGCYYSCRETTEKYAVSKKPLSEWRIVSCASTGTKKWVVWRQDDNGNKFRIKDFEYEVDANFLVLEFETKGHKQTYWREKLQG